MSDYSYISNAHPEYIDRLFKDYQADKNSVDPSWQQFFEGFNFALDNSGAMTQLLGDGGLDETQLDKEVRVHRLIKAYRKKGHLLSDTNPIRARKDRGANLGIENFGLEESDLQTDFWVGNQIGLGKTTLQNIIQRLQDTYCSSIGIEYTYVSQLEALFWLRERLESKGKDFGFDVEKKKSILRKLNEAVVFEDFLGRKYLAQKRFSLEGGEATIAALDAIINSAGNDDIQEVVVGMAHRGRLSVLANIMGKTYQEIFSEFEGAVPKDHVMGDGDVKYHLGFSAQLKNNKDKDLYLKLLPNPSHLEAVAPVVQGYSRAKADTVYQSDYDRMLPILIHGDAAIAGQGIAYEMAQMSQLEGYDVGGIIHFIINNQIGFTTDFDDARTSDYCTSVASAVKSPVLHVNGDDAEAVVYAAELAVEYRQKFNKDIYIDMVCYRKHGHNEGDDPSYTQPEMYNIIKKHKNPRDIYIQKLLNDGSVSNDVPKKLNAEFNKMLQERFDEVHQNPLPYEPQAPDLAWESLRPSTREDFEDSPVTGISKADFETLAEAILSTPDDFTPHRKIRKALAKNRKAIVDNQKLDWAAGELLAYGSILKDGGNIRMSGEDVKRGTFSHRHAVINDEKKYTEYNRLSRISDSQGKFLIYNSLLSEYGVLGFECGYSMASPDTLTIWEAQFGDFANGAQIIIDQFMTSSESKWGYNSGLVTLLPHGYEGQGPEHSSARLERFLQACGEKNITVANITTPANFFHAIRRQQARPFRKPLVVMSPKSLLRHPECVSDVADIVGKEAKFQEIIDDSFVKNKKKVKTVLLCSGKIYYELAAKQKAEDRHDVAIVRIEQLYPLTYNQLNTVLKQYGDSRKKYGSAKVVWVQEEPANMGALWHILFRLDYLDIKYVARKTSASPATGYKKQHQKEQADIMKRAFSF
ncbi:MAG: 2-oxoglutarate dehydrogenase E1 component [Chitinophagales bacterium]